MKKKETKGLRQKSISELRLLALDAKLKLSEEAAKAAVGKSKNVKKFKTLRKDLAQTLTLIKEKELVEEITKLKAKEGKQK